MTTHILTAACSWSAHIIPMFFALAAHEFWFHCRKLSSLTCQAVQLYLTTTWMTLAMWSALLPIISSISVLTGSCTCPLACSSLHGHLFAVNWLLRVVRGVCDHREFLVELLAEPWGIRRHSGAYIPGPESMFDQLSKCSLWRCCWRRTSNFELITTLCLLCIVVVQYLYIPIELMFWCMKWWSKHACALSVLGVRVVVWWQHLKTNTLKQKHAYACMLNLVCCCTLSNRVAKFVSHPV